MISHSVFREVAIGFASTSNNIYVLLFSIFICRFILLSTSNSAKTALSIHVTSDFTSPRACAIRITCRKSLSRWHLWTSWSLPWVWRINCWGLWPLKRNLNLRKRRISLFWKVLQIKNRCVMNSVLEGIGMLRSWGNSYPWDFYDDKTTWHTSRNL